MSSKAILMSLEKLRYADRVITPKGHKVIALLAEEGKILLEVFCVTMLISRVKNKTRFFVLNLYFLGFLYPRLGI